MKREPVIVIGAGLGGLAAAIRMRARGWPVLVLEANEQAGGRAAVFARDGFTFDAGPTVITAPYLIDELFACAGRRREEYLELLPVDPFYRVCFPDGERFDYVGDEERILAQIEALSPRDVDGYRRLADHARRIFELGYLQLADQPFSRLSDMLRVVPDMVRLESYRTVHGLVSKYIHDERLRQVFTFQPLLVGGNPFDTSSIYLLIHWLERRWGVFFPRGGTGALVRALVTLLGEMGGELRLNAPVDEIEVRHGVARAVRLESGERLPCRFVVANADPTVVYRRMVPAEHRPRHRDARLSRVRQSMSLFVAYFGTERRYDDVKHHTILLGPRYRGLLDDIFHARRLADDFSLYLHRPTASDPSLAPEGKDAWYVLSPVPNQRSGVDWSAVGERYLASILASLERTLPGLRAELSTSFFVDPRYFAGALRSADGAAFGPEPLLSQSAWMRFHNRSPDVDGLFFVGAGTHPGAGVPGVLCSAKVLERVAPAPLPRERVPVPAASRRAA